MKYWLDYGFSEKEELPKGIKIEDIGLITGGSRIETMAKKLHLPYGRALTKALLDQSKDHVEQPSDRLFFTQLLRSLLEKGEHIIYLALGSLTNLAFALVAVPELEGQLSTVSFYGGSIYPAQGQGAIQDDPQAAQAVIEGPFKKIILTKELFDELGCEKSYGEILSGYLKNPSLFKVMNSPILVEEATMDGQAYLCIVPDCEDNSASATLLVGFEGGQN